MVKNISKSCGDCLLKDICKYRTIKEDLNTIITQVLEQYDTGKPIEKDLGELFNVNLSCEFFRLCPAPNNGLNLYSMCCCTNDQGK